MKDKTIKLKKGQLYIHESGEAKPEGVIIDFYDDNMEELIDTFTVWYNDVEDDEE